MDLVPWRRSFDELDRFRKEMDDVFKSFFGEKPLARVFTRDWAPLADISETKDAVIIKAELPGLDANDIEVSLSGDVLTIRGEKKQEKEEKDEHHHYEERYYGKFQRVIQIPARVRSEKIKAAFEKGVLKITLPKTEEAKTKEIKIEVS